MMATKDEIAAAAKRVQDWLDGGCSSWGLPRGDIQKLVNAAKAKSA